MVTIIAALYSYFFVFQGKNLEAIMEALPYIFSGDPEHPVLNPIETLFTDIKALFGMSRLFSTVVLLGVFCSLFAKRLQLPCVFKALVFLLASVCYFRYQFIVCIKHDISEYNTLNFQMFAMALLGFLAYVLLDNKPKKLLYCFYIPGIIYTYFFSLSSNTGLVGMSMTLSVCGIAGVVFITLFGTEICGMFNRLAVKRVAGISIALLLVFQISSEIYVKCTRYFWGAPVQNMKQTIECGAAKGIRCTATEKQTYEFEYDVINYFRTTYLREKEEIRFLSLEFKPVIYLDAELPFGTFSSWTYPVDRNIGRLRAYYSMNEDKKPTVIFSDLENEAFFNDLFDDKEFKKYERNGYFLYVINKK